MRVPFMFYKGSIFATLISIFGSVFCLTGVAVAVNEDIVTGIILIVVGVVCLFLAGRIHERAIFRKWIEKLKKAGVLEQLPTSVEACIAVYKANPCKRTIKFISKYNPAIAEKLLSEVNKK